MRSLTLLASTVTLLASTVSTLGINCRGSGLCPLATWDNNSPLPIIQIIRDALYANKAPDSLPYNSGDHVICVSNTLTINVSVPIIDPTGITSGIPLGSWHLGGKIKDGGICLFPQYLKSGPTTLGMVRKLVDKLLEHGCGTCGSVPIHFVDQGSNDPGDGILTFNYVKHPYCTENCLTDGLVNDVGGGNKTAAPAAAAQKPRMAKRILSRIAGRMATVDESDSHNTASLKKRDVPVTIDIPASSETSSTNAAPLGGSGVDRKEKRVMDENAETVEEKRELSTRSARFVDLASRRNEGSGGIKGWIGWLRL